MHIDPSANVSVSRCCLIPMLISIGQSKTKKAAPKPSEKVGVPPYRLVPYLDPCWPAQNQEICHQVVGESMCYLLTSVLS
jgi:hypothetical protein